MHPSKIDPLNGYALLAVSLMGCISPVFTLLLLHSHGVRSWFGTILSAVCWLLNTIVFFMLVRNLTGSLGNSLAIERVLRGLFETDFCGGSSAMVLCQEWTGSNPLGYLAGFYNQEMIPNIHNIPIIWVYTTLVFLVLVILQLRHKDPARGRTPIQVFAPGLKVTFSQRLGRGLRSLEFQFFLLSLAVVIFSLTLGYQYSMVSTYEEMGVIDKGSWAFGQVVAVLFWVPALLEAVKSYFGMYCAARRCHIITKANCSIETTKTKVDGPTLARPEPMQVKFSSGSYESYRPLAHSPAPSPRIPGQDDGTHHVGGLSEQAAGTELRPLQPRRTLRMEEGHH